jgi:hypothetical protein
MDATLATRRDELHEALNWAQGLLEPKEHLSSPTTPLYSLATALQMTPAEISRALNATGSLPVATFGRISKPSRNSLYRITVQTNEAHVPPSIIAKCFQEDKVTFFSACYRREHGVLSILQEANAPVPTVLGGYMGARQAVLFMTDLGTQDLSLAMQALPDTDQAGRLELLRRGVEALVTIRVNALPLTIRLEREIAKIVKEVLTPEYYLNTMIIALNRILELERRQLSATERGRLEIALRPLITRLLDVPKTFIHFEYTPGNLHLADGKAIAVDFEQSTMGPGAFDLATLLYSPEADLSREDVASLLALYHDLLPTDAPVAFEIHPDILTAAAIIKMLFYAGSAANFYRKFEESGRLTAMEWYLRTADQLLLSNPEYFELAQILRRCWHGQTHLPV